MTKKKFKIPEVGEKKELCRKKDCRVEKTYTEN